MTKRHGGARPNSGGKRQPVGRPPGPDPHARTVSISLSQSSDALLDTLQARLSEDERCAVTASEVVRRALVELERTIDGIEDREDPDESDECDAGAAKTSVAGREFVADVVGYVADIPKQ